MIDAEAPNITDVPYEAAIAAFGALFAGIFGLFASYCRKSRVIRIIYAFLSLRKCFLMIIKNCQNGHPNDSLIVNNY